MQIQISDPEQIIEVSSFVERGIEKPLLHSYDSSTDITFHLNKRRLGRKVKTFANCSDHCLIDLIISKCLPPPFTFSLPACLCNNPPQNYQHLFFALTSETNEEAFWPVLLPQTPNSESWTLHNPVVTLLTLVHQNWPNCWSVKLKAARNGTLLVVIWNMTLTPEQKHKKLCWW